MAIFLSFTCRILSIKGAFISAAITNGISKYGFVKLRYFSLWGVVLISEKISQSFFCPNSKDSLHVFVGTRIIGFLIFSSIIFI